MNPRFSRFKDKHMMPGQTIEREVGTAPVVVLPAGEAAMLVRIAEVASEYERYRTWTARNELFRLAKEWRQEWRNKRNT